MPRPRADLVLPALVALLVLPALAPLATAQTSGSDLQVVQVGVVNPRYRVATSIVVTIENRGDQPFDQTSGWQVFLGWNGVDDSDCVNAQGAVSSVNTNRECYVRINPGFNAPIDPGERVQFTVPWTPIGTGADPQRGDGQIFVHVARFGNVQNAGQASNPPAGPDSVSSNNVRAFPVTVHAPAVVAQPDRDAPPESADKNTWWRWEQIRDQADPDCRPADEVTRKGCRATPGKSVRFAYVVHNVGTLSDSFTGSVVYDTGTREADLAAKGYRFTLSSTVISLGPQAKQTVYLDVFVPQAEVHNKGLNLNDSGDPSPKLALRWRSSVNPDVHTANLDHCPPAMTCRDPSFPSLFANVRRGINVTSNETHKPVEAGRLTTFNARIENVGNDADNYTITLVTDRSDVTSAWKPTINPPGVIAAGGAANATIDLTPPSDAVKGPYRFELRFQSQGDATGELVRNLTFTADLQQRHGLLSDLLPSSSEVAPGQKATYALTVTNTGNGPDNATIALGNLPTGWEVTMAPDRLSLAPLGKATAQLNVTAPPGTAAGARAAVKVNVTSQGSNNPSGTPLERAPEVTADLLVLSRPHPSMTLEGPARRFVDPGAPTEYLLTVRNVGNLASNFTMSLQASDPSWGATATPGHLVLAPLEQGVIAVRLRAPNDAPVGETLTVVATIRSASDQTQVEQTTLTGMVSGPDLAVKGVVANRTTPYAGDPLALDVVVANEGNKAPPTNATLRVLFIQAGVERVVGERDLDPADLPGGRRFTERIVWDTTGVEGPGVLVARVDPADTVREIDDSARSNEASLALTLRTFDLGLTAPQPLQGRPGEKVSYVERPNVFVLRHRGNAATEPVRVLVESENGWIDPEKASIPLDLPRGVDVPVPLDVLIPFRPGVPSDLLRVTVVPDLRPESPLSASVVTRVVDEEKPVIVSVAARPAQAKVGENVTLEALVRDATGVASVTATLVAPDNGTSQLPMAHVGGERWALGQTFTAAGRYRVFVDAVDRGEPANANSTRNALVEFFIDPGSAPTIQLAEGQATTLRSGTPVRLNVTDAFGVARAAYVIRGITYGMERPYQIDTSGFPAGTVDVQVEAENVYGAKGTARFTLTIDNTPPDAPRVRMSPESPRANEDVTLTIEVDPGVQAVDVLIRRDGQIVETRPATRKGPGVFELLLNPGEGDYQLDVTAKDAAGNTKLAEGAVSFSAKPKSPFDVPGPGLALLALALVGAALAARRRR